jgi:hypothetical protein
MGLGQGCAARWGITGDVLVRLCVHALGALVVTALAALIPDKLMERVPWATLTWVVTLCALAYVTYVLLPYATKT